MNDVAKAIPILNTILALLALRQSPLLNELNEDVDALVAKMRASLPTLPAGSSWDELIAQAAAEARAPLADVAATAQAEIGKLDAKDKE